MMKLFSRNRIEKRQDSYTDTLVALIQRTAGGGTAAVSGATGALEVASGFWQRAFQSARVASYDAAVLHPEVLGIIGRGLVRRGEVVFLIDVHDGAIDLIPAQSQTLKGGPRRWTYEVTVGGPSETKTYKGLPADAVLHFRYAVDAARPWLGRSPVEVASLAGRLDAELAASLSDEAAGTRGQLLPVPVDADRVIEDLQSDIASLGGKTALVQAGDFGAPGEPRATWDPRRMGPNPPQPLVTLYKASAQMVMSACGVPPALVDAADSQGSGAREAYRMFYHSTISPVARNVERELRRKLDAPELMLDFKALGAADVQGRARAYNSIMQGGGIGAETARKLTGLE